MIEVSRFWRDPALPFVEARRVGDGRQVCYAAHSHESFSIGVITGGRSTYLNGDLRIQVGAGTTVLMNPGVVHTCNPIDGEPWSYLMLFVDLPGYRRKALNCRRKPGVTRLRCTTGYCRRLQTCSMRVCLTGKAAWPPVRLIAGLSRRQCPCQ